MWVIAPIIWILLAVYLIGSLLTRNSSKKVGFLIVSSVWGVLMIYFSVSTIFSRALIEVNGTIIKTKKEPYFPDQLRETRYACIYTIESSSGDGTIQYIAHQNDITLAQDLPIGTRIEKKKWEITYKLNNEVIEDFPTEGYIHIGCLGILLVLISIIRICYYYVSR